MKYDAGMTHLHGAVLAAVRLMLTFDTEITKEFSPSDGSPAPLREYLKNKYKLSGRGDSEVHFSCDLNKMSINLKRPLNNKGDYELQLSWSQLTVFIRNNWGEVFKKESDIPCDSCCNYPGTKDDYQGKESEENGMKRCEFYGGTDRISQTSTKISCEKMPEGGRVYENKDPEGAELIQCCWHGGENCPLLNEETESGIPEDIDEDFDDDSEEGLDDVPGENDEDEEEPDDGVDITKDGPALKALAAAFLDNEIKCPNFRNGGECKTRCLTLDGRVGALEFKCSECTMAFSKVDKAIDWLAKCSYYPEECFYYQKSQEGKTMENKIEARANPEISTERQEKALRLHKQIVANASIAARCLVEMGRDLKIVRDEKLYTEFGCESFDDYCETKAGIGERHGYNFIKVYERFGEDKLEQLSSLGIKKLLDLSRLDDNDVEELVSSGEAESLSTRKLNERIKELEHKNEQLTLDFDSEKEDKENKAREADKLRAEIEKLRSTIDEAKRANASISKQHEVASAEVFKLKEQIEQIKSKPAEVRELSEEEKNQIRAEAETAIRQEIEEKADNERQAAVDEATKKISEKYASEIERLQSENASLKSSSKPVVPDGGKEKIKFFLAKIESAFNAMADVIEGMNTEEQEKYKKVAKTAIERMLNALGG